LKSSAKTDVISILVVTLKLIVSVEKNSSAPLRTALADYNQPYAQKQETMILAILGIQHKKGDESIVFGRSIRRLTVFRRGKERQVSKAKRPHAPFSRSRRKRIKSAVVLREQNFGPHIVQ
jgi:hypothetical protein